MAKKEDRIEELKRWFKTIDIDEDTKCAEFIPILHNKDKVFLQFCGISINLYPDGTWMLEDTTGG